MEKIMVAGIMVEVQKKPIKNIHIHVKAPKGKIIVTAPRHTSNKMIADIIQEKNDWIRRQQSQMAMRMQKYQQKNEDWESQREKLHEKISEYLPKWEVRTGLYCSTWQIRKMKTRWGSCNVKTKKVWFNLHLAQATTTCLEYIILHELLHIRIPNHGVDFKASMDKYMPNWREVKKELNQYILF